MDTTRNHAPVQDHAVAHRAAHLAPNRSAGQLLVLGSARRDPGRHGLAGLPSACVPRAEPRNAPRRRNRHSRRRPVRGRSGVPAWVDRAHQQVPSTSGARGPSTNTTSATGGSTTWSWKPSGTASRAPSTPAVWQGSGRARLRTVVARPATSACSRSWRTQPTRNSTKRWSGWAGQFDANTFAPERVRFDNPKVRWRKAFGGRRSG